MSQKCNSSLVFIFIKELFVPVHNAWLPSRLKICHGLLTGFRNVSVASASHYIQDGSIAVGNAEVAYATEITLITLSNATLDKNLWKGCYKIMLSGSRTCNDQIWERVSGRYHFDIFKQLWQFCCKQFVGYARPRKNVAFDHLRVVLLCRLRSWSRAAHFVQRTYLRGLRWVRR